MTMVYRFAVVPLVVFALTCKACPLSTPGGYGQMELFTYKSCSSKSGNTFGFGILDDIHTRNLWPRNKHCMAIPKSPAVYADDYTVFVHLLNYIGNGRENYGHPGLVFNYMDSNNYDFVFVRPHSPNLCYGYGYFRHGKIFYDYTKSKVCKNGAPPGRKWHFFKLHVKNNKTFLFVNHRLMAYFPHTSRNIARAGPAIMNGFNNKVLFRGFVVIPYYDSSSC